MPLSLFTRTTLELECFILFVIDSMTRYRRELFLGVNDKNRTKTIFFRILDYKLYKTFIVHLHTAGTLGAREIFFQGLREGRVDKQSAKDEKNMLC